MKSILISYQLGQLSEAEAVSAMIQHVLSKCLSLYLTNELINMINEWSRGELPTNQLEKIN